MGFIMEGEKNLNQINSTKNTKNESNYNTSYNSRGGRGGNRYNNKNNNNNYRGKNQNYQNQNQKFNKNKKFRQEERVDPYTKQFLLYRAEMYILLKYPFLIDINNKKENFLDIIKPKSDFFVIKSFSEEDIHKAIKYNLWSSTKTGNSTLDESFRNTKENGADTYLFFSTNASGKFSGIARIKGNLQEDKIFPFWSQDQKWAGIFEIEWIFIKDCPLREFKNIIIPMRDGETKCVTNSRDTQKIPEIEGKDMVEIFKNYVYSNTILEHFEYYDLRQENYERSNPLN